MDNSRVFVTGNETRILITRRSVLCLQCEGEVGKEEGKIGGKEEVGGHEWEVGLEGVSLDPSVVLSGVMFQVMWAAMAPLHQMPHQKLPNEF